MSDLPTQADILEQRLRQRECEHEFRFTGNSATQAGVLYNYRCDRCGRERQDLVPSRTSDGVYNVFMS